MTLQECKAADQILSQGDVLQEGKHWPHLEPDRALGTENVEGAGDQADHNGAPGLNGGGSGCDCDQASQGAIAHDAHIVHMLACSPTSLLSVPGVWLSGSDVGVGLLAVGASMPQQSGSVYRQILSAQDRANLGVLAEGDRSFSWRNSPDTR